MSKERRTFRPYDIPVALERFLVDARLLVGDHEDIFVEPSSRRVVSEAELRSGFFTLSLARDAAAFDELLDQAMTAAAGEYPEATVSLVVVVTSGYLKIAEAIVDRPLAESNDDAADRRSTRPRIRSIFHGCDVEAGLVLMTELGEVVLRPWRKATWLSQDRVRASHRVSTGPGSTSSRSLTIAYRAPPTRRRPCGSSSWAFRHWR